MWKKELNEAKDKIDYVTFKRTFYKGWYALKLIGKDGYVMITSKGECAIEIHESEVAEVVDYIKANGFNLSKYSVIS